ncbi:MAG: nucleotide exchange factor GrpE [Patescibacteria group bacterium]|nr:nucleotide exchange factor GrpE [Patescibacteria group bacterium]
MTTKPKKEKIKAKLPADEIQKLSKKVKEIEKEKEEYLALAQRCKADFLNYKKEEGERIKELIDFEKEGWTLELLSILDYFESAEAGITEEEKNSPILKGFLQIQKYFEDFLKNQGVETLDTQVSTKFDPNFDEVIEVKEDKKKEEGIILEVIQKGYKLDNKLIRPSKVKVSEKNKLEINN